MSKILGLKKRLTIAEAARYLESALSEPVCEADVIDLALQGTLKLSLDIFNGSAAREATLVDLDCEPATLHADEIIPVGDNGQKLLERGAITQIRGVFELPFFAGVEVHLKEVRRRLEGKDDIELISMFGYIVSQGDSYYRLYDYFENFSTIKGSRAHGDKLVGDRSPTTEHMVASFAKDREALLKNFSEHMHNGYVPRHSMPSDATLFVSLAALDALLRENTTSDAQANISTPPPRRVHSTALLEILDAATKRWWLNYDPTDPSTAPTNPEVTAWILKEYSISNNLAAAMASILRADGVPNGRRPS